MKTIDLTTIPTLEAWYENDPSARWKANLPFTPGFPLYTGISAETCSIVYFELEPGHLLGEHTDSAEEVVLIINGTAEATVGDSTKQLMKGGVVIIPALAPHKIKNIGSDKVQCLGFFSQTDVRSEFTELVQPMGLKAIGSAK